MRGWTITQNTGTKRGAGIGPWCKKRSVVWAELACPRVHAVGVLDVDHRRNGVDNRFQAFLAIAQGYFSAFRHCDVGAEDHGAAVDDDDHHQPVGHHRHGGQNVDLRRRHQ